MKKVKDIGEAYNSYFAKRLRKLMGNDDTNEMNKVKQNELADFCDTTRQTISNYINGTTFPTSDKIFKIAAYFGVSSDYLLGLTNTPTPIKTDEQRALRTACDYTGLKEKTIQFFYLNKVNRPYIDNKDTVELLETLVDKLAHSIDVNTTITNLKVDTKVFYDYLCEYDENSSLKFIEKQIEQAEECNESINGKKYKLSQLFNEVLDDYSISNTELSSIIDLRVKMYKLYMHRDELLKNLNLKTYKEIYKDDIMRDISNALKELEQKESENNEEE
jgi:transcriptional regulator with XRE-family HTH domain